MFEQRVNRSKFGSAIAIGELIYHSAVHSIRVSHRHALWSIFINMLQAVIFVLSFYAMFEILGMRRNAIRGDFLLYLMSGIFLYMTHVKTLGAVAGAGTATSPMMKHAPMNTAVMIGAAALSTLYIQVLSLFLILFVYHVAFTPITIDQPVYAMGMLLLAWFTGIGVGLVLLSLRPWAPQFVSVFSQVYQRANMIASGKMFVANSLPGYMVAMFDWNPLFHAIDQCRGFVFLNYTPHNSSITYPLLVGVGLCMLGLMGEFYTRRHVSLSWDAKR
ncbi:ABC-type polysaccharide/polyol phosphate export permease [Pseudooceanicola nitratireducens]|jgi:ABC-type polysaccharide/polyol phosphate export permease|uniref:ABC-type polysaccharide/polyol phosphate export permease n=1 Tax=Pseudooceanicola nitratireducens TaxID=517719 RepID=A0A1I1HFE7_9RHOB|nr:ABC transporter permease [Pseudooceanicola nitratireducens]SEJ11507.1 ABC-type polysaccharide/polyol phosphate export permease [Pseudooceanicola nitratireducens]SFC22435.1 ABC-type polysaccharide/polyol phosphate export permease [Pseudooceanicola nitratireducens]